MGDIGCGGVWWCYLWFFEVKLKLKLTALCLPLASCATKVPNAGAITGDNNDITQAITQNMGTFDSKEQVGIYLVIVFISVFIGILLTISYLLFRKKYGILISLAMMTGGIASVFSGAGILVWLFF